MSAFSLLLALVVAAPLAAQQPDSTGLAPRDSGISRRFDGRHGFRYRHRRGTAFDPARLLARKATLGLSAGQMSQLTALAAGARSGRASARQQMQSERAAIAAGLRAESPDTTQLKRHFAALHAATGTARWSRISVALQARAVLTAAQRDKVRGWAALRRGRWHSKGHRNRL